MTATQLRKQAKERLDGLPPDKVRVAAEFLDYLDTQIEKLTCPGFKDWRVERK